MRQDKGGPNVLSSTVRHELSRALNRHAGSLAEKTLAKALQGDSTAQLACAELLKLGMYQPDLQQGSVKAT